MISDRCPYPLSGHQDRSLPFEIREALLRCFSEYTILLPVLVISDSSSLLNSLIATNLLKPLPHLQAWVLPASVQVGSMDLLLVRVQMQMQVSLLDLEELSALLSNVVACVIDCDSIKMLKCTKELLLKSQEIKGTQDAGPEKLIVCSQSLSDMNGFFQEDVSRLCTFLERREGSPGEEFLEKLRGELASVLPRPDNMCTPIDLIEKIVRIGIDFAPLKSPILGQRGREEFPRSYQIPPSAAAFNTTFDRVADQLQSQFEEEFVPILIIGNESRGKSALLQALLGERSLQGSVNVGEGVAVYPYPVNFGDAQTSLLILEASGVNFNSIPAGCQRKILATLFPIASLCVICCENSEMENFHREALNVHANLGAESALQKILIFVHSQGDSGEHHSHENAVKSSNLCNIIETEGDEISEDGMTHLLNDIKELNRYSCATVEPTIQHWLRTAMRFSEIARNYTRYDDIIAANLSSSTPQKLFSIQSDGMESLTIEENTLQLLKSLFNKCEKLTPVLVIGHTQFGKSSLVEALLNSDSAPFQSVSGEEGVFVWPRPVPLQDTNLLLMEMTGLDLDDDDPVRRATIDKLIVIMAALSSHLILCFEKTSLLANFKRFCSIQDTVKRMLGRAPPNLVVLISSIETMKKGRLANDFTAMKQYVASDFTILERGSNGVTSSCLEEIKTLLAESQKQLTIDTYAGGNPIHQFVNFAQMCEAIANRTAFCRNFVKEFERYANEYINKDSFRKIIANRKRIAEFKGSRLLSRNADSVNIDRETLQGLHSEFDLDAPTIVLSVIADQGLGKSTLLNHIVRFLGQLLVAPEAFKTGNTITHTTVDSEVFMFPLQLKDHQCMLIDLQGLEGSETADQLQRIAQNRLISSVLALVSVPLIIIRNEKNSEIFLENRLKKIQEIMTYYHYTVERIMLLFYDRDLSAQENEIWTETIRKLEDRYFCGNKVIRRINKPNFVSSSDEIQDEFLTQLLEQCNFPKKNDSGGLVRLLEVIERIESIARDLQDIQVMRIGNEELTTCDRMKEKCKKLIEENFENIKCSGESLSAFAKEDIETIRKRILKELTRYSVPVQRKCAFEFEIISERVLKKARLIENWYEQVEYMEDYNLVDAFSQYIKEAREMSLCYYGIARSKSAYRNILVRLCDKVRDLHLHYPNHKYFGKFVDALDMEIESNQKFPYLNVSLKWADMNIKKLLKSSKIVSSKKRIKSLQHKSVIDLDSDVLNNTDAIIILIVGGNANEMNLFAKKLVEAISIFTVQECFEFYKVDKPQMLSFDFVDESKQKRRLYVLSVELSIDSLEISGALFALASNVYIINSQSSTESRAKLEALVLSYQRFRLEGVSQDVTIFDPRASAQESFRIDLNRLARRVTSVADSMHLHELLSDIPTIIRSTPAVPRQTIEQVLSKVS